VGKIRCLAARRSPDIEIEVQLADHRGAPPYYKYALGVRQENTGNRKVLLRHERVWCEGKLVLDRPDKDDEEDEFLLTETHLEQISRNARFREMARFFQSVLYLHLVPQLVRNPRAFSGPGVAGDPFGRSFLERIATTNQRTRRSRLRRIEQVLTQAVPYLKELTHVIDEAEGGVPHLEAVYEHWRPQGAKQRERELSDGTLRLIGLCWMLLEGESLVLMEEPELSLNTEIIRKLPALFHKMTGQKKKKKRQVMLSTHSWELLSDTGIGGEEVLLLRPDPEGTEVGVASSIPEVRALLEGGLSVADAVMPRAAPEDLTGVQLELF
jgi:predicted ATPase